MRHLVLAFCALCFLSSHSFAEVLIYRGTHTRTNISNSGKQIIPEKRIWIHDPFTNQIGIISYQPKKPANNFYFTGVTSTIRVFHSGTSLRSNTVFSSSSSTDNGGGNFGHNDLLVLGADSEFQPNPNFPTSVRVGPKILSGTGTSRGVAGESTSVDRAKITLRLDLPATHTANKNNKSLAAVMADEVAKLEAQGWEAYPL